MRRLKNNYKLFIVLMGFWLFLNLSLRPLNLIKEIYISSFSYIKRIIKKDCQPFITEVELEVKDPLIITIISNSITLTPGTITVNAEGNKLTVLSLKDCKDGPETVRKEIRENFERYFI